MFVTLRGRIDFDQLSKVYILMTKLMHDRISVLSEAIGGYLKLLSAVACAKLLSKEPGIVKGASAKMPSQNHLGISLESYERVSIAHAALLFKRIPLQSLFDLSSFPSCQRSTIFRRIQRHEQACP